jgi:hypothetical protein
VTPTENTDDEGWLAIACLLSLAAVAIESDTDDVYKDVVKVGQDLKKAV